MYVLIICVVCKINFMLQIKGKDLKTEHIMLFQELALLNFCWHCSDKILTKNGHLVNWQCDCFFRGVPKECALLSPKRTRALGALTLWLFIVGVSNNWASSKPKNMGPCCSDTGIVFLGVSNDLVQPKTSNFSTRALIWVHYKAVH